MKRFSFGLKPVLAVLLLCFTFTQGYAQTEAEIKKELETFLNSFAQDYANLPKTRNKQAVLRHFSPEALSSLYIFNISGKARVTQSDYAGFEAYLDNVIRSVGIYIGYEIVELHVTHATSSIAVLTYKVNYETKEEDGIWVKGNETVTMALEKRAGQWVVVNYTIVQVEDEKLKGVCLCEIFSAATPEDGEVVVKTTIPSGRSYSNKFDNFEFKTVGSDQLIRVGDYAFKRLASGIVLAVVDGEEIQLGVSANKRETVLTIIEKYLYRDSCTRLKVK
ncbi:MAG: nuclear transport factor 2 family protein [Bacteroidia bacterium]|nr:nuclear transport factor 2 family protein [Bacteroidia bacterium]